MTGDVATLTASGRCTVLSRRSARGQPVPPECRRGTRIARVDHPHPALRALGVARAGDFVVLVEDEPRVGRPAAEGLTQELGERVGGLHVSENLGAGRPAPDPYEPKSRTGNAPSALQAETARLSREWNRRKLVDVEEGEGGDALARLSAEMMSIVAKSAAVHDGLQPASDDVVERDPSGVGPDGQLFCEGGWVSSFVAGGDPDSDTKLVADPTEGYVDKQDVVWVPPAEPGPYDIWAVLRDSRASTSATCPVIAGDAHASADAGTARRRRRPRGGSPARRGVRHGS